MKPEDIALEQCYSIDVPYYESGVFLAELTGSVSERRALRGVRVMTAASIRYNTLSYEVSRHIGISEW
jgi:hypothetical protein